MTDEEIIRDMRLAFEAEKNAGEPTGWAVGSRLGSLWMGVPLEIQVPTIGTARLAFRAVERTPEADASISLIITIQGRDLRAWRMDWRPLHTHTNMCGSKELRGLVSNTGIHDFECNACLGLTRMQTGDLPLCICRRRSSRLRRVCQVCFSRASGLTDRAIPRSAMVTDAILRNDIESLRQIADEVARGLAYAKTVGGDVFVQTSVATPSGRNVGIKLLGGPVEFTITDNGFAMREAELMGADNICRREARKVAKECGLTFNEWELFEAKAPADRLVGLSALLANAVALTLIRTSEKFTERFEMRRREELSVRLCRVFGERRVTRNADFHGVAKSWVFDARVDLPSGRPGLFSVVTPAPVSVTFAYVKLDDVSRLENPPFLAAVLDGGVDAGDKALLSRPARKLFLVTDTDDEFRMAA